VLVAAGLGGAFLLEHYFFFPVLAYFLLQVFYSLLLRQMIILDALAIALGFILRVFAGAWVLPVPLSSWLVLSTIGLALLLAFGKRRSERTILAAGGLDLKTRKTLERYPDTLLDASISMSAAYAILSYSLFAFQTSPLPATPLFETLLPATIARPKLMMLTVPLVIYAVSRYLYVIYEKKEGESPGKVLLSDYPLLISVVVWGLAVVGIIYWL
jgi:4-hydroxybenzoate polyprenyltransferase